MTKAVLILSLLLAGISAARAAGPIKAMYCVAVDVTQNPAQDQQLTQMMGEFAAVHALKPLAHQGADTHAYRSADETVELAVTSGVPDMGSIVTLFDVNKPAGPASKQLASYVKAKVEPSFKVTQCSDIPGFKTPEIK